jgi:hypothetical protein
MSVNTENVQNAAVPSTVPVAGPTSVHGNAVPADLEPHLRRLGVTDAVQIVVDAARQAYPDAERIEVSIFRDEYNEERVRVKAIVPDEGDAETEKYFRCLSLWTSAIDPSAADKIIFTSA